MTRFVRWYWVKDHDGRRSSGVRKPVTSWHRLREDGKTACGREPDSGYARQYSEAIPLSGAVCKKCGVA